MKIQELLDKVGEYDIGLFELTSFSIDIRNSSNKTLTIDSLKIDEKSKKIIIKVK